VVGEGQMIRKYRDNRKGKELGSTGKAGSAAESPQESQRWP